MEERICGKEGREENKGTGGRYRREKGGGGTEGGWTPPIFEM